MSRPLWIVVAAGVAVRVVLGFSTRGAAFDVESFEIVRRALAADPMQLYSAVNEGYARWPYPPLFLPWVAVAGWLSETVGLRFDGWLQLPVIAADAGIAWVAHELLRMRRAPERVRAGAVALVMFGPSFLLTSGYHGQIDALAILPALAALLVWERGGSRRALLAGALVGVGGAIKVVPLVMILPLLVCARSRREALELAAAASAVLVAALAPYLVSDAGALIDALRNRGFPGLGGLSLILNPDLADAALRGTASEPTRVTRVIVDRGWLVPAVALAAAAGLLWRRRPDPALGAAVVFLVLMALGVNFALQYAVWGLPFLIVLGWLGRAALLQLALLPAAITFYGAPWDSSVPVVVYSAAMIAAWLLLLALLAQALARVVSGARGKPQRSRTAVAGR